MVLAFLQNLGWPELIVIGLPAFFGVCLVVLIKNSQWAKDRQDRKEVERLERSIRKKQLQKRLRDMEGKGQDR